MDRKLLDLLVCPVSRQPLALLDPAGLAAINAAAADGALRRADDSAQSTPLREALVTHDRKLVYRIDDGIPVLLAEEAIPTGQVADFPKADRSHA
ncbi:Trm112 family protein [uncultured Luteimonas sp.]|uniref:Trm112 family protein n=1 Tax=uncultured Luteimonas sp. TaxID=453144 RepID=UPI0026376988|nr:Trm112 family protein [uncultured Luteimonas sp.]